MTGFPLSLPVRRFLSRARARVIALLFALLRRLPRQWRFGPPRGWFRLADLVREGKVPGRIIAESQPTPNPSRTALRRAAKLDQDLQCPRVIFWSRHERAELVGPSLLLRNHRNEVAVEGAFGWPYIESDPSYLAIKLPDPVSLEGRWTSMISRWGESYYHWMFDALPRMAVLPEFPPDTRVLVPATLHSYQLDTLRWLGVESRYRRTSEQHLIIEEYYLASPPAHTGCFNPYALAFLRRSFLPHMEASYAGPKRFFLTRAGVSRGVSNLDEVHEFFRTRGWAIVDAATMPLARQIKLFADAEAICAIHGAGLANTAFCQPGCRVLELLATNFLNGVYEGVAEAAGLDYDFLICPADRHFRAHVDLGELARKLAE